MSDFKVDKSSLTPLHDQVAGAIRRAIADGEARPGERLPPAKDLAAVMGVNTNTVLRALRTLREIDVLATAYGWTETEILRLSPWRRQAYLEIIQS